MTPAEAAMELGRIKSMFLFLTETPSIDPAWEALVVGHGVSGKPAHDARLIAAMQVRGLTAEVTAQPQEKKVERASQRSSYEAAPLRSSG